MPADCLSHNVVDAVAIFDDNWKMAQEQDEYYEIVNQHMSKKNNCQCKQLEVSSLASLKMDSCGE